MKVVALICLGSFMITSLYVGIRVAMLFSRTRRLPELLLSIALLFTGFLAFAVGTTAKIFVEGTESLRRALVLAGLGQVHDLLAARVGPANQQHAVVPEHVGLGALVP